MVLTEVTKPKKQLSLAEICFLPKTGKHTRKAVFLAEMETVVPWSRLEALIESFYPKKGKGRPPIPLGTILRIHLLQQWFGYSDPAMEEALHDVPLLRQFVGLDAFADLMPNESTILSFRHLLEKNDLAVAIFAEVNAALSEQGLSIKHGTVVDATLIAAPSSTKNGDKQPDPEMTQTKKGNQWHFGMKAHIGVDADSGLVHTVVCTYAKVEDIAMMEACLHGEESQALGDRDYHKKNRTIDDFEQEGALVVLTPTKKPAGGALTDEQKAFNWMLSAVRAIVEHPFRVVIAPVWFHEGSLSGSFFALANLWLARKRLLPLLGEVRP